MAYRELTEVDIVIFKKVDICKGEDCIDKTLRHKSEKWKSDPKK